MNDPYLQSMLHLALLGAAFPPNSRFMVVLAVALMAVVITIALTLSERTIKGLKETLTEDFYGRS